MASQLELSARAALCTQLAKREPANRALWMAEAENWSRLSNETSRRAGANIKQSTANAIIARTVDRNPLPITVALKKTSLSTAA
jgi:hypothetical protein